MLILHTTFILEEIELVIARIELKTVIKKAGLLEHKPSFKVIISAISQSANIMAHFIISLYLVEVLGNEI